MAKLEGTNFPDQEFLESLTAHLAEKVDSNQSTIEKLVMHSGARMNWIADFITDPNIDWKKEEFHLDDLWLSGTNPDWNRIIIEQCERSPKKLRELMNSREDVASVFASAQFEDIPILVRFDEEKFKVLDGMHRAVAAIRDGKESITAFVARLNGERFMPIVEPHVVYDLIKAYQRSKEKDRAALVGALRLLKDNYSNVEWLLKNRFNKSWIPSDEIQEILQEV